MLTAFLFNADIQTNFKGLWLSLDTVCDVIYLIDIFIKFRTRRLQSGLYEKGIAELTNATFAQVFLCFLNFRENCIFYGRTISVSYVRVRLKKARAVMI